MSSGREPEHVQESTANQTPATNRLAVGSWSWHDAYYAGAWSLLNLPADAASVGIPAIECNDFMLPPRASAGYAARSCRWRPARRASYGATVGRRYTGCLLELLRAEFLSWPGRSTVISQRRSRNGQPSSFI